MNTTITTPDDENNYYLSLLRKTVNVIRNKSNCEWTRGYIDAIHDQIKPQNSDVARSIFAKYDSSNKIAAMREIRAAFGFGLKECRAMCDKYWNSGKIVFPEDYEDN